jgi:hypothetical protein
VKPGNSIEKLQKKPLVFVGTVAGIVFIIMAYGPKFSSLYTFPPTATATIIPIYFSIDNISIQIKQRS